MNKKKSLKGFTLVELIVVMAVFGILMTAVLRVINPLNKLSKRATIQEANAAAVDNMKYYFESSLRYAECIDTYVGGLTDKDNKLYSGDPDTKINSAVVDFINNHYTNRSKPGTETAEPLEGVVRMLKIDNGNGGRVTEYQWDFTAGYTYRNCFEADTKVGSEEEDVTYKKGELKVKAVLDEYGNPKTETNPETGKKYTVVEPDYGRVDAVLENKVENEDVINSVYYENYAFYIAPGFNQFDTIWDEENVSGFGDVEDNSDDYYAVLSPAVKEIKNEDDSITKVQYNDENKYFNNDMFSLTVVTFKNDTETEGKETNYAYKGTYTKDGTVRPAFHSPFAVSNSNMSLVNINSVYSQGKNATDNWGPVRYNGPKRIDESGTLKEYTPTTKVDSKKGTWLYEAITNTTTPLLNSRMYAHEAIKDETKSDDCIYFIYTLPELK